MAVFSKYFGSENSTFQRQSGVYDQVDYDGLSVISISHKMMMDPSRWSATFREQIRSQTLEACSLTVPVSTSM